MTNPTTATDTATEFQVGATYTTRFACDADSHLAYTVVKRTKKFITIEDHHGDTNRVGVTVGCDGAEYAFPTGKYSMAPIIRADRQ